MKKLLKALPILMTVFMVLMTVTPVLATVGGITIDIQTEDAASKITPITNNILGIIQVIGVSNTWWEAQKKKQNTKRQWSHI